jgi:sporulation protein YlmC with PRC-barrel domain
MLKHLLATTASVVMLSAPSFAQQQEQPPIQQPAEETAAADEEATVAAQPAPSADAFIVAQEVGQVRVDRVVGKSIVNPQDEEVGRINDLVFDEEGRLVAAVIGVGGFLGIGQRNVAVNWNEIEWTALDDGEVELTIPFNREQLEEAPEFKDLAAIRAEEERAQTEQQMQQQMQQQPAAPDLPPQQ